MGSLSFLTSFYLPLLAVGSLSLGVADSPSGRTEAGPLFHDLALTLSLGDRVEAIGPLVWTEKTPTLTGWGLNPLVSYRSEVGVERTQFDFLYPLVTHDRYGDQGRWQVLQFLSWGGGPGSDGTTAQRFTVFPFYFQQNSTDPAQSYQALLPFYGTLKNRLFRDEIRFLAFPLWMQTRKRDVITDNYLAPFLHRRRGGANGWQLWPVYGQETRVPLRRTSKLTDLPEIVPGHEKRFLAWPFLLSEIQGVGSANPTTNRAVLPLLSTTRSPNQDNTTVLWPFFTKTVNREKQFEEWGAPWPFIGWANGEGKSARRIWPLYGRAANTNVSSLFVLWPAYSRKDLVTENLERKSTRGLLYLWNDVSVRDRQSGAEYRRRSLWPLVYHWRDREGRERLQLLAGAEGAFPYNEGIQRAWSPLWSLYRSEKNPKADAASQSLLWNLWRRESQTGKNQSSFLFGFVKSETTAEGRAWGWFWRKPTLKKTVIHAKP